MKRSERLTPVLELAETRESQAAQNLGQSQRKLETARQRLQSLKSFRENYADQFLRSGDKGFGVRQLTEYRAFLGKVNNAVAEQEKLVRHAEVEVEKRRTEWEDARRKTMGLRKVLENARADEVRSEEKRQQSEQDERASRRGGGRDGTLLAVFL